MAKILYLPDGSHEIISGNIDESRRELEQIIRDRLGNDAASLFNDVCDPHSDEMNAMEQEMQSYEESCDNYQACLCEVLESLAAVKQLLGEKRRKWDKINGMINCTMDLIRNEI